LEITNIGSTFLVSTSCKLILTNVLHVSSITKPLLCISRLVSYNNVYVVFNVSACFVKDRVNHQILLQNTLHDGLYMLHAPRPSHQVFSAEVASLKTWHQRLAHSSSSILQHQHLACKSNKLDVCDSCSKAKSHRLPFVSSTSQATKSLEVVHCDLWGSSPITSHNGYRYYVLFTDEFSRYN
jgi:GAG-pre-integrase domain